MNRKPVHRTAHPALRAAAPDGSDPCAMVLYLQQKYVELITGGAPTEIETPLLGRVQFAPANADQLGRMLGEWQNRCAQASGQPTLARRPISFETEY